MRVRRVHGGEHDDNGDYEEPISRGDRQAVHMNRQT